MEKSTIGVAIPTYNRNDYLVKLLDTIPADVAVNVSDNGAFVTQTIKDKYSNASFDSFPEVIHMYNNWNRAIKGLDAEWICAASDDDLFLEGAFVKLRNIIRQFPTAEVIILGNEHIDGAGNYTFVWKPDVEGLYEPPNGFFPFKYGVDAKMIGVFFKKSLYESVGGFNEEYKVTASDSHFVQKLILKGNTVFVKDAISQYRIWGNNLTSQTIATRAWIDEVIYWQEYIGVELRKNGVSEKDIANYQDEVMSRNLIGSLTTLRNQKKNFSTLIRFVRQFPLPMHATFKTQLSIIKCLLASLVKR